MTVSLRLERHNHVVIGVLALKNDWCVRRNTAILMAGSFEMPDKAFYDRSVKFTQVQSFNGIERNPTGVLLSKI